MKLQNTPNLQLNNRQQTPKNSLNVKNSNLKNQNSLNSQVSFGGLEGAVTTGLNFFATNQAWGAALVDLFSMVVPRTAIDFTRSKEAGTETLRRESYSAVNDALVGGYGLGAAYLLSKAFNNKYNVASNKMFISNDMIDVIGNKWQESLQPGQGKKATLAQRLTGKLQSMVGKKEDPLRKFLNGFVDDLEAFHPSSADSKEGWTKLQDKEVRKEIVDILHSNISKENFLELDKNTVNILKSKIADNTGSINRYRLSHGDKIAEASLTDLIEDVSKLAGAFKQEKVLEAFKQPMADNQFLSRLKGLNGKIAILGIGMCTFVGMLAQPLNMYLTKKKTGKEGFVGGGDPDKSQGFKLLKLGVGASAATATVLSIVGSPKNLGKLVEKIQFKGFNPTIPQFKLIYGATIVSRLLSSRNKEELTETSIKDSLGFVNWLILGGFVSKLTALGLEKMAKFKDPNVSNEFIRHHANDGKPRWLRGELINREEVLHEALKNTIKADGKSMSMSEMMATAAKKCPEAVKKVRMLALVQFAGYIYSGVVLGVGLPKLNIAINKAFQERKHKKEQQANLNTQKA